MSEQEKTEAVQSEEQAGEEQPAVEKESSATETEQKPDTSEGEKPAETPQEAQPAQEGAEVAPKETEPAAKESEPAPKEEQPAEEEEPEEEEPDDGVPIVLVTGASGFIATHLIKQLLEQGRYRVRGTVRSKKKEEKVKPLLELVPDAKYPIRLVEADLSKPETWQKAVKRCTFVFHVASPFPAGATNEAVIVRTAVEGTTNVLQACTDAGTIKRVVVTSSIAAVSAGSAGNPSNPPDYVYTEKDWSEESVCGPYIKSKLKAEQAAWEFVKNLDESKQFELAVVNPGYVQGPLLSASSGEGSKEFAQRLLNNKMPALPDVAIAMVDVRDVAAAHIAAMEKSEAAGNRYILSNRTISFKEYAQIVGDEFRPQGYKIASKNMPKVVMWVGKFFDSGIKQMYSSLGKNVQVSNERMVNELGVQPRPIKESIIDTCYSLIDFGLARKTAGYLGHPSTRPPPPEPEPPKEEGAAKDESQTQEDKPQESQPAAETTEDKPAESKTPATTTTEEKPAESETPATTTEEKPAESEAPATTEEKPAESETTEDKTAESETTTEEKPAETEASETPAASEEQQKSEEDKPAETSEAEPASGETSEAATEDKPAEEAETSEEQKQE